LLQGALDEDLRLGERHPLDEKVVDLAHLFMKIAGYVGLLVFIGSIGFIGSVGY
jgi:hypothetical protein